MITVVAVKRQPNPGCHYGSIATVVRTGEKLYAKDSRNKELL
jgi:hypothetical protein